MGGFEGYLGSNLIKFSTKMGFILEFLLILLGKPILFVLIFHILSSQKKIYLCTARVKECTRHWDFMKSQKKCACPHVFTVACCDCFLYRGTIGFPGSSDGRGSPCNAGDPGLISGLGRSPGEGNDKLLQYSCLESPMDRGSWWAPVHGVKESDATKRLTHTGVPYAHFYTNIFMFLSPAP